MIERPAAKAPKRQWADYARNLEVDVDGMTREQIIEACDVVTETDISHPNTEGAPLTSVEGNAGDTIAVTPESSSVPDVATFSGPVHELALPKHPDPTTVVVTDTARGRQVDVHVNGRVIRRAEGHFGRGANRWHVSYRTNR